MNKIGLINSGFLALSILKIEDKLVRKKQEK